MREVSSCMSSETPRPNVSFVPINLRRISAPSLSTGPCSFHKAKEGTLK